MNIIIFGAAGSGKTAISLNILANTSKAGIKTVFASLDMHRNRLYEKAMYKATGLNREQLYAAFKEGREAELVAKLKEEFGNVYFFNKSSPTVQDIRDYIHECEEQSGEKIKLVMVDYFERVTSEFSDETQASKKVAGDLQDMVNDLGVALITLVQPNKFGISGGPDTPLYEYTKIKGSSFMFQSARIILSLWRPFYTPQTREYDRYMQMAVLKNDLGELTEFAFNWHGPTGTISELEDFQYEELDQLLDKKAREKDGSKNDDSGY
jgi:replicative DNA helicase